MSSSLPDLRVLRPMLATATATTPPLDDARLVYEPKYDGIRVLVEIVPRRPRARVRLVSRLGNDKTAQFPEIVDALARRPVASRSRVVADGEIVALDEAGEPASFLRLQRRLHRASVDERDVAAQPVALVLFDLLGDGRLDLRDRPLTERRARLERVFEGRAAASPLVRLGETVPGDGRALLRRARARGWEGLIVKRAESPYRAGRRSPDWRKLKLTRRQELVVGGWTAPQGSRAHFGALLLGYHEGGALRYAGRVGSGFDERALADISRRLRELETRRSPFDPAPRFGGRAHWTRPVLVVEVRFTEWTDGGLLRHPIFLGLRDDKRASDVHRETGRARTRSGVPGRRGRSGRNESRRRDAAPPSAPDAIDRAALDRLHADLLAIEADRGDGIVTLPDGARLSVTNLRKVFWPQGALTKGALLRYYVRVAPWLLAVVEDRPLVMKRLPNGIRGKAFYQQRAPDTVPEGVRVERVDGDTDVPARLVGGSLLTLLHMAQLAAVSQDPWFSRVGSPHAPDHAAIDLDPGDGVPFARVLDTARWVRDELESLGVRGFPKTSGADGLHIYIPLDAGTPYQAGLIFCQIVATIVAQKHPAVASVERQVQARGRTVYLDYLQNIEGKTLACAYSARASEYAGASTPVTWQEIDEGFDRRDFTIETLPARLDRVGDLWAELRRAKGANLLAVERYVEGSGREG